MELEALANELIFLRIRQNDMFDHIRRWNIWRKRCLNGPIHKILVLFGVTKSPTMASVWLPEEEKEIMDAIVKGENDEP